MVDALAERAKRVREKLVEPEEDNMLKITNDGRKLALDQRLINPDLPDDPDSKVNMCVKNVLDVYESTKDQHSTQMIFCDQSTPSPDKFNVYDDIREKLINAGVKPDEIAFIQSAKNEKEKDALFDKVRKGITPTLKIPTNFEMFQTYIKFLKNIFGFIVDGVITSEFYSALLS